jgi:hypothetical protein
MAAREYTPEEEARLGLKSLPEIPFIGPEESHRRREIYEASRKAHREAVPIVDVGGSGDPATRSLLEKP